MEDHWRCVGVPLLVLLLSGCLSPVCAVDMQAIFHNDYFSGDVFMTQTSERDNTIEGWTNFHNTSEKFSTLIALKMISVTCYEASQAIKEGTDMNEVAVRYFTSKGKLLSKDRNKEDGDKVVFDKTEGVSLFGGHEHSVKSLLIVKCQGEENCEDSKKVVECVKLWDTFQMSIEIIIVICLTVVFLFLLITIPAAYICIRRIRKRNKKKREQRQTEG